MLDLVKYDPAKVAEAGFEFNVVLPDGTETDATITVRGKHSKKVQEFSRKLAKEQSMKEQAAIRRGKKIDPDFEELDDLYVQVAINRVITWKGLAKDGVEVPFTEENAEKILRDYPFLREQILEESDNLLNFRFD